MLRQINQEESILMSVATNGSAGVTVFVRVSDNRYARVPAGAAERDRLTWDSYYPAAPFFCLFSQFHDYNRNVISLRHHSANGKVSLLRSNELIYPKLSGPFVEFHKAIFWVGGWDPYSLPRFSNRSSKTIICLKSATKLFSVLLASKRPLITELADKLRLKYPLLPTISPCPTMRLEAIRSIIPISCRRYPKSV